ncbi:MAG: hypothetical protein JRI97_01165, partial [Deltaproteobacteria bacterium]|nr:hypothetical protein [Deltaproteobacteria bacterium]
MADDTKKNDSIEDDLDGLLGGDERKEEPITAPEGFLSGTTIEEEVRFIDPENFEILIVEDSRTQAMQLQMLLEGQGYKVAVA